MDIYRSSNAGDPSPKMSSITRFPHWSSSNMGIVPIIRHQPARDDRRLWGSWWVRPRRVIGFHKKDKSTSRRGLTPFKTNCYVIPRPGSHGNSKLSTDKWTNKGKRIEQKLRDAGSRSTGSIYPKGSFGMGSPYPQEFNFFFQYSVKFWQTADTWWRVLQYFWRKNLKKINILFCN